MAAPAVKVRGLREYIRAADASGKATKKAVRDRLRRAAETVRAGTQERLGGIDPPVNAGTVGGVVTVVRRTGVVSVEQKRKRTTGKRGDFAALQMRDAFVPALEENADRVGRELERALDDIADIFERG